MLAGAGTVLSPKQAADALAAGAQFIVAPGFNPAVVDYCLERGVAVFPGVCTPTEIEAAMQKGLSVLKSQRVMVSRQPMATVRPAAHPAASAYRLAQRYELAFAAAACLRVWDANRAPTDVWWRDDLWLHLCLRELVTHEPYTTPAWHRSDVTDRVVDALAAAVRDDDRVTLFGGLR